MVSQFQDKKQTAFEFTPETIPFKSCPLAGRIGAEIKGVDLNQNLSDQVVQAIRQTLVKYKVIFFRNQDLDSSGQVAFARRFGQLTSAHPTMSPLDGHPEVLELDCRRESDRGNHWHTDITFIDRPPMGSILRAVEIPPVGGDTIWANTTTAYQDLPQPLRQFADQLWAVHSNVYDSAEATFNLSDSLRDAKKLYTSTVYQALHPVVHVHPESGERALLLGSFVCQLQEFPKAESRQIFQLLQAYILRPRNTVRWCTFSRKMARLSNSWHGIIKREILLEQGLHYFRYIITHQVPLSNSWRKLLHNYSDS